MPGTNLIVFRENAEYVSRTKLAARLIETAEKAQACRDEDVVINALLIAGQAECGVADAATPFVNPAQQLTDEFARMLVGTRNGQENVTALAREVAENLPERVRITPPEGFAYYGLHPLDFAEVASAVRQVSSVAVIGIRSIGTVLSAVTLAALEKMGVAASRITVRPEGHPYDRRTNFTAGQIAWIHQHKQRGSAFLIADEGPGLSGSSFLSIGEALQDCGVATDEITLIGTREVDPNQLCTADAARRWNRFRYHKVGSSIWRKFRNLSALGAGAWRQHFFDVEDNWPSCWPEMERLKFLAADRSQLLKFDGFGPCGEQVRDRANAIYKAGFGPKAENAGDGMTGYEFIAGPPLARSDMTPELLEQIADYCAFRASEFRVDGGPGETLEKMAHHNFEQEFGRELKLQKGCLDPVCPVLVDGRMQPHEWIRSADGRVLKVDACSHGDDHFQPGPTDIAWDLAGTIIEWGLDQNSEGYLLERYRERSGDDARPRLPQFVLAYALFRMAYSKMAMNATQTSAEKMRLGCSYGIYSARACPAAAHALSCF